MGIRKKYCYTVECNYCDSVLEDYFGDLIDVTYTREDAERIAIENGWKKLGKNTWMCPECIEFSK